MFVQSAIPAATLSALRLLEMKEDELATNRPREPVILAAVEAATLVLPMLPLLLLPGVSFVRTAVVVCIVDRFDEGWTNSCMTAVVVLLLLLLLFAVMVNGLAATSA